MDAKAYIQPIVCIQFSIVLTRYIIGYSPSLIDYHWLHVRYRKIEIEFIGHGFGSHLEMWG